MSETSRFDYIDDMNHIIDNLWLGGHPSDIQNKPYTARPFKHVFALNGRPTYYISNGQLVITRPFDDNEYKLPDEEMLHDTAELVLKYSNKGLTLVHCAMGINRSGLIMGLALVKSGMTPKTAIDLMREKRSDLVLTNQLFHDWLMKQVPPDRLLEYV